MRRYCVVLPSRCRLTSCGAGGRERHRSPGPGEPERRDRHVVRLVAQLREERLADRLHDPDLGRRETLAPALDRLARDAFAARRVGAVHDRDLEQRRLVLEPEPVTERAHLVLGRGGEALEALDPHALGAVPLERGERGPDDPAPEQAHQDGVVGAAAALAVGLELGGLGHPASGGGAVPVLVRGHDGARVADEADDLRLGERGQQLVDPVDVPGRLLAPALAAVVARAQAAERLEVRVAAPAQLTREGA